MGNLQPQRKLRLNRPFNQNFLVGCMLFCLPGIYLALTGLGAGGGRPSSQSVASKTNAILYGFFTVFGWMGGSILNILKPRWTFMIGAAGYPLYVGGLWYFDRHGKEWFPLFAGATLGITAGFLWTACGFVQFAYAEETEKATYITVQWVMTSLGGTVGSCIAFGVNFHEIKPTGVSTPVYATFVTIMCLAVLIAIFIVDPKDIVRDDGTRLATFPPTNVWSEIKGVFACFMEPRILLLLPSMFVAEICLVLVSSINGYFFNLRTRSLNNIIFELAMIPAPIALAWVMDTKYVKKRRLRGMLGAGMIGAIAMGVNAGLLVYIKVHNIDRNEPPPGTDWSDSSYVGGVILYLLAGIVYAGFQICSQWILGALTNDPAKCARYAGIFKGTTSLGLCVWFVLDGQGVSYRIQQILQFALYGVGVISLFLVTWFFVNDTNYFLEDGVIAPRHVARETILRETSELPGMKARMSDEFVDPV